MPTLCPRLGAKIAFRDLDIEENALFLNKKGACFYFKRALSTSKKGTFHLEEKGTFRKKGTFRVLEIWGGGGASDPPPRFRRLA